MTTPIEVERYVKFETDKATLITVERLSVCKSCSFFSFAECTFNTSSSLLAESVRPDSVALSFAISALARTQPSRAWNANRMGTLDVYGRLGWVLIA